MNRKRAPSIIGGSCWRKTTSENEEQMRNPKVIAGIAIAVLLCNLAWQIGTRELANAELRDDMHDIASQLGARIGLTDGKTDNDFRNDVIDKAKKYDIQLEPEQITVERRGEGIYATMYLATDYRVPVRLPGFSFQLHFNAESGPRPN
jgi:hypothetical protein